MTTYPPAIFTRRRSRPWTPPPLYYEPRFWMVWTPHHPSTPRILHTSEAMARRIARNMARRYFGNVYYVMEMKSCHQLQLGMCDWWADPVKKINKTQRLTG